MRYFLIALLLMIFSVSCHNKKNIELRLSPQKGDVYKLGHTFYIYTIAANHDTKQYREFEVKNEGIMELEVVDIEEKLIYMNCTFKELGIEASNNDTKYIDIYTDGTGAMDAFHDSLNIYYNKILDQILHKTFTITLDQYYTVKQIKGLDSIITYALNFIPKDLNPSDKLAETMITALDKHILEGIAKMLPRKPLNKNHTWYKTLSMVNNSDTLSMNESNAKVKYTVKGINDKQTIISGDGTVPDTLTEIEVGLWALYDYKMAVNGAYTSNAIFETSTGWIDSADITYLFQSNIVNDDHDTLATTWMETYERYTGSKVK